MSYWLPRGARDALSTGTIKALSFEFDMEILIHENFFAIIGIFLRDVATMFAGAAGRKAVANSSMRRDLEYFRGVRTISTMPIATYSMRATLSLTNLTCATTRLGWDDFTPPNSAIDVTSRNGWKRN
jgi:hypothetical protein